MKRTRLRNKFLNTKSDTDRKAYNAQRNLCVTLISQNHMISQNQIKNNAKREKTKGKPSRNF